MGQVIKIKSMYERVIAEPFARHWKSARATLPGLRKVDFDEAVEWLYAKGISVGEWLRMDSADRALRLWEAEDFAGDYTYPGDGEPEKEEDGDG